MSNTLFPPTQQCVQCCKLSDTTVVMVNLWIQSTSANKQPREVMDYVSDKVGEWISETLNCSDKIWLVTIIFLCVDNKETYAHYLHTQ